MPGSPATTPNLGIPRIADGDTAAFAADLNAVSDTVDASPYIHLTGDLIVSAATSRAGCLLCNGSAVSRTTYADLFAAISVNYGSGDGSTTFNLPDFRGRTIVGADSGGVHLPVNHPVLGASGGEEQHTLTTSEMPAHTHQLLNAPTTTVTKTAGSDNAAGPPVNNPTTTSTGGGGAHNNLQPYATANVFIKT